MHGNDWEYLPTRISDDVVVARVRVFESCIEIDTSNPGYTFFCLVRLVVLEPTSFEGIAAVGKLGDEGGEGGEVAVNSNATQRGRFTDSVTVGIS